MMYWGIHVHMHVACVYIYSALEGFSNALQDRCVCYTYIVRTCCRLTDIQWYAHDYILLLLISVYPEVIVLSQHNHMYFLWQTVYQHSHSLYCASRHWAIDTLWYTMHSYILILCKCIYMHI